MISASAQDDDPLTRQRHDSIYGYRWIWPLRWSVARLVRRWPPPFEVGERLPTGVAPIVGPAIPRAAGAISRPDAPLTRVGETSQTTASAAR